MSLFIYMSPSHSSFLRLLHIILRKSAFQFYLYKKEYLLFFKKKLKEKHNMKKKNQQNIEKIEANQASFSPQL